VNYEDTLEEEIKTWNIADDEKRAEKIRREKIRHYKLIKDLLLDKLDTHNMVIAEVGGGPSPVSDLLDFGYRNVFDPNTDAYKEYWPCRDHIAKKIEDVEIQEFYDLVICTNALDHVEKPATALLKMQEMLAPGGFLALLCAENNALTNPHPAHIHNLTSEWVHDYLDSNFETVWELNYANDGYRYGWAEYEGKRGQPAFAILLRKCTGYK
jgi:SAM-dependent methyltransferase